ncbi:MAG TPA: sugar ABC transporter substrate-binding protein [Pseudonocardia sp.]|jgi:simple sugar transport system substrate-binding protein|nr:sugar ABC transporter substrate-binding protein [Pseudonocardia sp.]
MRITPTTRLLAPLLVALLAALLALAGCQGKPAESASPRVGIKIIMVTHGQAGDPYWSVVKHGADDAARDLGVSVSYQAPQSYDVFEMQKLLEGAIAQHPAGIAVSIPDADALGPLIKKAVAAGIPVVSLDSGERDAAKLGVLTHVGASEFDAAKLAGERFGAEGVKKLACLNHEQGNVSLDVRCEGLRAGLAETGGTATNLAINGKDPTDSQQRLTTAFRSGSYDGAIALGPVGVGPMLAAAKTTGFTGKLASFDLSPEILQAIDAGTAEFAIDFQQYLMGYLPVLYLVQHAQYQLSPSQAITPTGPAFVTKENASKILKLTQQGVR